MTARTEPPAIQPASCSSSSDRAKLAWFLAHRYLSGRRSRLLSNTARAALGSTGLGVAAMIVATSLMNGYTDTLLEKMVRAGAMIVIPLGAFDAGAEEPHPRPAVVGQLEALPGGATVSYSVLGQGTVVSERRPTGLDVQLRGVLPDSTILAATAEQLEVQNGQPGVVLGRELADRLGVASGDPVRIVALNSNGGDPFRFRTARVSGTLATGLSLFDQSYAIMALDIVEDLAGLSGTYEVALEDHGQLEQALQSARETLGDGYIVRDWRESSPGLFTALALQKWALFLVLGLIVLVSMLNIVSTLIVLVRERTRDIGLLMSLGARPQTVRRCFHICGVLLGAAGTAVGIALGTGLCWLATKLEILRFDSDVAAIYFIDVVPFHVRASDLVAVAALTLLLSLLASWYPAWRSSRIQPAQALRYE